MVGSGRQEVWKKSGGWIIVFDFILFGFVTWVGFAVFFVFFAFAFSVCR